MAVDLEIDLGARGTVSARLDRGRDPSCLYVLAHGAGAGMRHVFMDAICERLVARGIATFRYQFPYLERGSRRPDHATVLEEAVRAAIGTAAETAPGLPLIAGGKSMGGRMSSRAAAAAPLPGVRGLVFLGFPLHPAGKPGTTRAEHLADVTVPMLFLQGTRDGLADLALLRPVVDRLGAGGRLHVVEGADHSFHVLVRSGRTDGEVLDELATAIAGFAAETCA
ncbi:MAG TPA: alpha/beta family hydrolase [Kofleriaceae bacterium]|nr:alpha/beta family hydrolase [Kofleriaceae bacterium]